MNCIKLIGADGSVRRVLLNYPFKRTPGDTIKIEKNCNPEEIEEPDRSIHFKIAISKKPVQQTKTDLQELDQQVGPGFGDLIKKLAKPVAKLVGKERCSACEVRRVIANSYKMLKDKHGMVEAVRKIKELTALTLTENDKVVLEKLKSYLNEEVRS